MKIYFHLAFFLLLSLAQAAIINSHALPFNSSNLASAPFLKDVLKAISRSERWDSEAVRVSGLEERSARFGRSKRYEFRIRVAKTVLDFRLSDDVVSWKKLKKLGVSLPNLIGGRVDFRPKRLTLGAFKLEGPLELYVGGDDQLLLQLPLNTTHTGLKRVIVGEGIKIKIKGAREASIIDPLNFGLLHNRSFVNEDRGHFILYGYTPCCSLLSVNVVGSASLVAYKTHNHKDFIVTAVHSLDTIELLPEKCYDDGHLRQNPSCSIFSLGLRLNHLKKLLRSFLGHRIIQNGALRFLKAKVTSLTLVKFWLELERDISGEDRIWKKVPDWKTKPTVDRARFEIVVRVESGGELKLVGVKKLSRPFVAVNSAAWSSLMSNISFTQFASLVPPEALTLDVKW